MLAKIVTASLATVALVSCSTPVAPNPETLVRLRNNPEGALIVVGGHMVDRSQLEAATLEQVVRNNPALSFDNYYRDARVVICSDRDVLFAQVQDVMLHLTRAGFENLSVQVAGEDCPS